MNKKLVDCVKINKGLFINILNDNKREDKDLFPPVKDAEWHKTIKLQKIKLIDKKIRKLEPLTLRDYFSGRNKGLKEIWTFPT